MCKETKSMLKFKNREYSIEEFSQICNESESVREVAEKLGYAPNGGGTAKRIKEVINQYSIDVSHFKGQGHTKNIGKHRTPIEDYLTNRVKITSHKLRIRLLEEGYFEYKCSCCGLSEWLNQPIPLELHHKDGDNENNELSNLELRCPNCHYFTETYKTKNWSTQNNESAE